MAVTDCTVCLNPLPAGAFKCPVCGYSIARPTRVSETQATPAVRGTIDATSTPGGSVLGGSDEMIAARTTDPSKSVSAPNVSQEWLTCPDSGCAHRNEPENTECFYCQTPLSRRTVALEWPWGQQLLTPAQEILIGRDEGPLTEQLTAYPNVSRRHALLIASEPVILRDLGSTNGTTVNGEPVPVGQSFTVCDGDCIGFGATLKAVARIT